MHIPDSPHLILLIALDAGVGILDMATMKQTRKKKRVSKHVLQAQEARKVDRPNAVDLPVPTQDEPKKISEIQPKKPKKSKTKDPIEAASYLSAWKHREAGGAWKFNKNTQSWLIRHMYEADKVAKATFVIMLEYLKGLPVNLRSRVVEVAEKRAVRYKEFEKTVTDKYEIGADKTNEKDQEAGDVKKDLVESVQERDDNGEDDDSRWKRLDEHHKRKEYKRARKILEILQ